MRRALVLAVLGSLAMTALATGPARAAPSNDNTEVIQAICDGQAITIAIVHKKNENADRVSSGPVIGGGSAKVASLTAFESGTTNVVFSAVSHYGGPTNAVCTHTATLGGEAVDVVVQVHLAGV
jgi:hypothetical protein